MEFKQTTKDFLDVEFFQTLQDRFSEEFGIASVITDVTGLPITKPSNFTNFCNLIRCTSAGDKKCQFFDSYGGCKANIDKKPIIYPCHAGLIDFASPILLGDTLVGCFLCGQILTEKPDKENFLSYANELGIDKEKYFDALDKVKILPYERIEYIANFLYKISSKMSNFIYYQNMGKSANFFFNNSIQEFEKDIERHHPSKIINPNSKKYFKNFYSKIFETFTYKADNKILDKINNNSQQISQISTEIITKIKDNIDTFNNFDTLEFKYNNPKNFH